MSTLYLEIKPSKIWLSLLVLLHLLAGIAVFYAAIHWFFKVSLIFILVGSLIWQIICHWRVQRYLVQAHESVLTVQYQLANKLTEMTLAKHCYLSPWLVIIYFTGKHQAQQVQFIWVDSVSLSAFKQLKRSLIHAEP